VKRTSEVKVTIEVDTDTHYRVAGEAVSCASIKFNDKTVYSEFVYDNEDTNPAEENIVSMFGDRLARLLDPDTYA
jgi:hypothetical protein